MLVLYSVQSLYDLLQYVYRGGVGGGGLSNGGDGALVVPEFTANAEGGAVKS